MQVPDTTLDRIAAIERQCREQREELNAVKCLVAASLTTVAESLKPTNARFARLAAEWKRSESPSSSARELAMHSAYQQIIGMGPVAIGWIIGELEKEPDHWFWALHCLTGGADPVPASDRGDINAMARAWIQWATENGYRP